ncbi:MAG: Gfo/Idh/MocA family oxidoreductase [Synoicihabitans sp.]
MGLGNYANSELRPALRETEHCHLAGVVTGSSRKGLGWSRRYGFPESSIYHYDDMEKMAENPTIDIVYVVTPNALHAEHCIAAAKAGKHVICEKPFTISVAEAEAVIAACDSSGVKLSLGYRLHFDPYHEVLRSMVREGGAGQFHEMFGDLSFTLQGQAWRTSKALAGGGPLMDLGVYVIQEACMATGEQSPISVKARELPKKRPENFVDVEESIEWEMEFPQGEICRGRTSYNASGNHFRAESDSAWFAMDPAFTPRGLAGATHEGPLSFPPLRQQALQMDDFANCILEDRESRVGGAMGRRDMKIIEAIYRSAETGRKIQLNWS